MIRNSRVVATLALIVAAHFLGSRAYAQEAPDALVQRISQEVVQSAHADKAVQNGDRRRITQLIETTILPHVDFERTTALAVGRFWHGATPEQKKQLTGEFRALLIHTYANALSQVRDQKFEFRPLRADPADVEVVVHSRVLQSRGAEPIQISYRLAKTSDGWKIYDVNFMGVWLIEAYKGNFSSTINQSGIDGLINTLREKNRKLDDNTAKPS